MDNNKIQQDIIKELGLDSLAEENQVELLTMMTESILKRITISVLEKLSEEDKVEFNKVRDEGDPEKIAEFLRTKIENYDEMTENIVKEFKEEMKETMGGLQKDLAE